MDNNSKCIYYIEILKYYYIILIVQKQYQY